VSQRKGLLRTLSARSSFRAPPAEVYQRTGGGYLPGHPSYATYNYCGNGLVARIKRAHFDAALDLTAHLAGGTGAIDFGCADGVFLPTLAGRFSPVVAIDDDADMIASTQAVVTALELPVRVLCNAGLSLDELAQRLDTERFGVVFLLETLEHVGVAEAMVQSRIDFVDRLFSIAAPGATIVVSVPTMVGLPFAVQRAALALTGGVREPISAMAFARAVVLYDVAPLEPAWSRTRHLGFNHRPLERAMRERFAEVRKRDLIFSKVYALRRDG
jgi:2-polyprenyl-3-methyl-5-hydroxy-6-metoxy-1,4-benzoquinol methylase